jgi:hypothetical protein
VNPQQRAALLAFLRRPLIDPRVAAASGPFERPRLYTEGGLVPVVLDGGVAGAGGIPQMVALEPPLAGNPSFTVGVFGAAGGAGATLVIDASEPPASGGIPNVATFAMQATTLQGSGASDGYGSVTIAIPNDPALYGTTLYGRWYVADETAPGGVASSPAFRMQIFGPNGTGTPLAVQPRAQVATMRLYTSQPNPFPSRTMVRFDLFTASAVDLSVFDVTGRRVRSLYRQPAVMPGVYTVSWDGRDDGGRSVPGGVYFYRLETDRGSQMSRVVRLD